MSDLVVSRRAVTRAILSTPILALPAPVGASLPLPDCTAWDRAMAKLENAERVYRTYDRDVLSPFSAEATRLFGKERWQGEAHERFLGWSRLQEYRNCDRLGDELLRRFCDAEFDAYAMPAPDNRALLWKLERMLADPSTGDIETHAETLLADSQRLLGEARS